jgi:hypothetical protein
LVEIPKFAMEINLCLRTNFLKFSKSSKAQ